MQHFNAPVYGDLYKQPFTIEEAAEYLQIDVEVLFRLAQAGRIQCVRKNGAPVFPLDALDQYRKAG